MIYCFAAVLTPKLTIIIIKLTLTTTFSYYRNPFETTEGFVEKYNQAQSSKEQDKYENLADVFLIRYKVTLLNDFFIVRPV